MVFPIQGFNNASGRHAIAPVFLQETQSEPIPFSQISKSLEEDILSHFEYLSQQTCLPTESRTGMTCHPNASDISPLDDLKKGFVDAKNKLDSAITILTSARQLTGDDKIKALGYLSESRDSFMKARNDLSSFLDSEARKGRHSYTGDNSWLQAALNEADKTIPDFEKSINAARSGSLDYEINGNKKSRRKR